MFQEHSSDECKKCNMFEPLQSAKNVDQWLNVKLLIEQNEATLVEEKRPAVQVNLGELLKQTGIVDDDDSFFLDDEPTPPQPVQQVQPQVALQSQPMHQPLAESKGNNVSHSKQMFQWKM